MNAPSRTRPIVLLIPSCTVLALLALAPRASGHDLSSDPSAAEPLILAHGYGAEEPQRTPPLREREVIDNANLSFPGVQNLALTGTVVDADTGKPVACRLHIENRDGIYYAPEAHRAIATPKENNRGIDYEPDVTNRGKIWAVLEDGSFTVQLPAMDGYRVEIVRGLEYERPVITLDLAGQTGEIEMNFPLRRGINMRERGWMSADTHVHNLTPVGAFRQMKAEALDYVNLMFIGPNHPLYRAGLMTGEPAIAEDGYIVYVSQEIRDAQQGHMTLIGQTEPIRPINARTGVEKNLPYIPHEPLNWEAYDRLHEQGGLAFHAHYLYWPGHGSAVSAALAKLDGVEWLIPDVVKRDNKTRQNIQVPGHPLTGGCAMWYYMLNCGCRLPVIGGTDKMNAGRVVGGGNRTYARIGSWDHDGFVNALGRGETFATNGPLLHFSANGRPIGSEIKFDGPGPFTVSAKAGCFTQKPINYFHVIQDGKVFHDLPVDETRKSVNLDVDLTFEKSGWIAVRCGNTERDRNNWENAYTAAHSSPIYVTVNDKMPAEKHSAEYMIARVGVALDWVKTTAQFSTDEYRQRAIASFEKAQRFYQKALERAAE